MTPAGRERAAQRRLAERASAAATAASTAAFSGLLLDHRAATTTRRVRESRS